MVWCGFDFGSKMLKKIQRMIVKRCVLIALAFLPPTCVIFLGEQDFHLHVNEG